MIRIYCVFALAGMMLWGCQQTPKGEKQESTTTPTTASVSYPSIPLDTLEMLWSKCDYIDFVFYNLSIAVSQNDPNAIKSTIQHVAADVPTISSACKPEGRIFFQVEGRNALVGDFFLGQGCFYYIWYKDGGKTPFAANSMTEMGAKFFKDLFEKALPPQQQPGN